jgi:hypothetical protein
MNFAVFLQNFDEILPPPKKKREKKKRIPFEAMRAQKKKKKEKEKKIAGISQKCSGNDKKR